jgi:integrase/recombinase XerC
MQIIPAVTGAAPPPLDYSAVLYQAFLSGRSTHTRDAYAMDAADFAAFMNLPSAGSALAHVCALNHGEANGLMLNYRNSLQAKGLATATINRRLSAIRSAARLARTLGVSTWQPEINGLKVQAYRDTLGPGLDGTRSMLAAARQQNAVKAARDVALIRLMFDLGLRRGEVAALDIADIDASGRRLWILGKGRTQKESRTLPEPTLVALNDWLAVRASIVSLDLAAVFVGLSGPEHGQRITGRGLYHVIASLGRSVGIKTRPHGLRHASITTALDANNGDVRAVQQHARHSKPETTMRYDDNRKDLAGRIANSIADAL